jgi:outer membrane lipoprotein-sorting protein
METAWSATNDYQTQVEVRTYKRDDSFESDRFTYTFKKPKSIRLDFESPHPGMVLVYPDRNGKAVIEPAGLARFLKLHLVPDNPLLRVSSGQSIDKTDLGLLIENISRSITDQRKGPVEVTNQDGTVKIRVLALNHFREGIVTLYEFFIDEALSLPVKVSESTPDGQLERMVTFSNLSINIGVRDTLFRLNGENGSGVRPKNGK